MDLTHVTKPEGLGRSIHAEEDWMLIIAVEGEMVIAKRMQKSESAEEDGGLFMTVFVSH